MDIFQRDPLYIGFIAGLILSAAISLSLIGYVRRRYSVSDTLPLLGVLFSVFWWSFGYLIEFTGTDLNTKLFSWNISYIGITSLPVMVLLFALQYSGYGKLITRRRVILLFIIPAITLLLQWTKNYHSLLYFDMYLNYDRPFLLVIKQYGPWFWIYWAYSFILLAASAVVLIYRSFRPKQISTAQPVYILLMIVPPAIANLIYVLRIIPIPHADWTPVALSISVIVMTLAIFNKDLLEIIPIARGNVFEMMLDGFIVINKKGYIIDFNKAAHDITLPEYNIAINSRLPDIVVNQLNIEFGAHPENKRVDIKLGQGDDTNYFTVNISPIYVHGKKFSATLLIFNDTTARQKAEIALRHFAYYDQLTELPNRVLFRDRAKLAIENAGRFNRKLAIMVLDLDKFKDTNDSWGHDAGDQLLHDFAQRLSQTIRKIDTVSRLGGDEFIILLPEISSDDKEVTVAERIVQSLTVPFQYENHSILVKCSIGIAVYPDDSQDLKTLIQYADTAMYRVKQSGGNNFLKYSSPQTAI